jgi:hypothetical protein
VILPIHSKDTQQRLNIRRSLVRHERSNSKNKNYNINLSTDNHRDDSYEEDHKKFNEKSPKAKIHKGKLNTMSDFYRGKKHNDLIDGMIRV